jgi:hypothetical protein
LSGFLGAPPQFILRGAQGVETIRRRAQAGQFWDGVRGLFLQSGNEAFQALGGLAGVLGGLHLPIVTQNPRRLPEVFGGGLALGGLNGLA